jgi:hypothetical protein
MSSSTSVAAKKFCFNPLNSENYPEWASDFKQYCRALDIWDSWQPKAPAPFEAAEKKALRLTKIKVVADLLLAMERDEKLHFTPLFGDSEDPLSFWQAIQARHSNKTAGTRYHTYSELFSITQQGDESISAYFN